MTETKDFPTVDVLMTATGRALADIGGVYMVLNWMTGENLFTHQLPRVSREAEHVLIAAYPLLADAIADAEHVDASNWREFRDKWIDRFGPVMAVPRMTISEHERIDPLSELAEKIRSENIFVINTGDER